MAAGQQQRKWRAVIIGGSMSGLFTAAFLRQIQDGDGLRPPWSRWKIASALNLHRKRGPQ